ncbi:MAG TPA: PAS domain S-box protein, partial [Firmicutes bacterium]|nr:PAS domain S-box protein [Bacillota bacterium]
VHSLVWIPLVQGDRIALLKKKAREEGLDFTLKEKDFSPTRSIKQDNNYYPVLYIEPKREHDRFIGLRTGLFPHRMMIYEHTLTRGSMTLVNSTFHPGKLEGRAAVSFVFPVFVSREEKEVRGYIEGVILMDRVIDSILKPQEQFHIGIEVLDPYGFVGSKTIYSRWPARVKKPFVKKTFIRVGDNEWVVHLAADRMFFRETPLIVPWLILGAGLLGMGLLLLFLRFVRLKEEYRKYHSEKTRLAILQSIGDAVIGTDTDGRIIEMNRMAEKLTGWRAKEAVGKSLEEVFHVINTRTGKRAYNPVEDILKGEAGGGLARYTILVAKDGTQYQIADSASPVKNRKGEIIGVVLVFRDVTEEYAVRKALEESEELFRTLTVSTPVAVMLYQEDKWVYVNPVSERITGYSAEELKKMNFWSIVHPDFQDIVKDRGGRRQRGEDASTGYEFKIIRKDGAECWVRLAGTTCIYKGKQAGLISVFDVTDFKLADEKVNKERDKAQAYLNVADVMMLALDRQGRVVMVNPKGCQILERNEEDILGKNWVDEFVPEPDRKETKTMLRDFMAEASDDVLYHENYILTGTGKKRYIAWRNAPLRDGTGKKTGLLSSGTDITEKREMEE